MTIPTSAEPAPPEPTSLPERLDVLDVLRGFALFGILLVNFTGALPRATGVAGHVVDWFIEVFATGSFHPLFAMLFGMGFVLQFARWEARRARHCASTFVASPGSSCSGWRCGAWSPPGGSSCSTPWQRSRCSRSEARARGLYS